MEEIPGNFYSFVLVYFQNWTFIPAEQRTAECYKPSKNSEEKADGSRNSIGFHPNTLPLLLQASVISKKR